jgi:F-type H+-transporting ATPase subunit a
VTGQLTVLAADVPFPPSVEDFYLPSILPWGSHDSYWFTKVTALLWITVALLIIFFLVSNRKPQLVPTKKQWIAESLYGFVRNNISIDMIGKEGVRFAPYLTTLLCFIVITNLFAIIPLFQISPNAHIAFPIVLGVISYFLFIYQGIKKHGAARYFKMNLFPPGLPWPIYILVTPIEIVSTFISRPVTLAVRLFANMFAGHLILLVFTLGGVVMLGSANVFVMGFSVFSFLMAIVMTFFEVMVIFLQAYVFTMLSASYLEGALADEH